MDDGSFLRQRRNVFVVCTILLALCLGGVDLKALTFAGMQFNAFKRPEVFLYGIWIAFGYFAYRFVVYFMEWSLVQLANFYWREMERVAAPRIRKVALGSHPHLNEYSDTYRGFLSRGRAYQGQEEPPAMEEGVRSPPSNFQLPIPMRKTLWWEFRGFLRFALLTPALSEHVLPLVLAALTLAYCGFVADWKGSLVPIVRGLLGLG